MIPNLSPYVAAILASEFSVNSLKELSALSFHELTEKGFDNFPLLIDLCNLFFFIKEEAVIQGNDFCCLIRTSGNFSHEVGICLFAYLAEVEFRHFDIISFNDDSCTLTSSHEFWGRALVIITRNQQESLANYNFAIDI